MRYKVNNGREGLAGVLWCAVLASMRAGWGGPHPSIPTLPRPIIINLVYSIPASRKPQVAIWSQMFRKDSSADS